MIRVGPAGWSYPDWEGRVYPRNKGRGFHGLAFLAETFDCLEVNSSFYAIPVARSTSRWAEMLRPFPNFRLTAKLYQGFTHRAESDSELGWEEDAARYRAGVAPLMRESRLDALLVQFAVSFQHGASALRRLAKIRNLFSEHKLVLEVRHSSWFTPSSLHEIRGLGYSLAHIDLPPAWNHPPDWHPVTGPVGYLRLHGRNAKNWFRREATRDDRYDYLYDNSELESLVGKARRIASDVDATYVVTNNHFEGQAIANGIEMQHMLTGKPVNASHEIVRAFPSLARFTQAHGQAELF
ncbi:MAG: hypothetical protein ACI841_004611 [Planctomycetota bacterium]